MNLDELVPAPSSSKVNALAKRVFGYALDLENISESRAEKLHKNLTAQMGLYESNMGAKVHNNSKYAEMKLALETLTKHIAERAVEEDDVEEDNAFNTAAAKAKKAGESHFSFNGKKYKVKMDAATADNLTDDVTESVVTEGQVESSELVMAAKSMVDKYDAMIQDVGEMLNEELQPLCDKIRDEMGSDIADSFHAQMETALNNTMTSMKSERGAVDSASRVLTGESDAEPMGDMGDDEIGADELDMEPTVDMDDFEASSAATGGEESPVGREKR
jgi:Arc/MetJ family transcription regulator